MGSTVQILLKRYIRKGNKNPQHTFLWRENKAIGLM
jgi:hypothetical protein